MFWLGDIVQPFTTLYFQFSLLSRVVICSKCNIEFILVRDCERDIFTWKKFCSHSQFGSVRFSLVQIKLENSTGDCSGTILLKFDFLFIFLALFPSVCFSFASFFFFCCKFVQWLCFGFHIVWYEAARVNICLTKNDIDIDLIYSITFANEFTRVYWMSDKIEYGREKGIYRV